MGRLPAPDPSVIPGVHFVYRDASGTENQITGQAQAGSITTGTWLRYGMIVRPADRSSRGSSRFFDLVMDWQFEVTATDDRLGGNTSLYWWNALRCFAVEQTLNDLDLGGSNQEPYMVDLGMREALRRHEFRTCRYQANTADRAVQCRADPNGDFTTTLAACAKCRVPDEWALCTYVDAVQTRGLRNDVGWSDRILLGGICQLGKALAQGVPVGCRGGAESEPCCFVPRIIESRKSLESYSEEDVEGLLSAVNVEWERRYKSGLFTLISYEPLKHLRGGSANAAEFHTCVAGIAELLAKLNENALRDMTPPGVTSSVQRGHTLTVLEAVLRELKYPRGESIIADLRLVQRLRNLPPTHPPDQGGARAIEALRELGVRWPVGRDEWPQAWARARARFTRALKTFLDDLRSAP